MKQAGPIAITGGTLVTPAGVVEGTLRLAEGRIAGVAVPAEEGDAIVRAEGRLVAPGLVDCGVFQVDKPAFHFGGITRAALMPDQAPPLGVPAGRLERGLEADVALIDPARPWIVDSNRMEARAGNTPFDRLPVEGRTLRLWKGGVPVD